MEPFWKSEFFRGMVYTLLVLFILFMLMQIKPLFIGVYGFLEAVLAPFVIAMIISYMLNPIVRMLHQRKVPRTAAVLLIYAVFITSVTVVLMNIIPIFIKQIQQFNEYLPELTMRAQNFVANINGNRLIPEGLRNGINRALISVENDFAKSISEFINTIGNTLNTVFVAFIIPFLAFYMLKDVQSIQQSTIAFIPKNHKKQVIKLIVDIDDALGNYVRGQLLVCLIVGALAYIGYLIIGMPYALLLATIVAMFNIIPYLGPFFGAAPAMVLASTVSWKMVLLVALVNFIVQTLEGNVISPQVVGRTLHMHPMLIIFALLVGGEIYGVVGLILAVPIFAVLKVVVHHVSVFYHERKT